MLIFLGIYFVLISLFKIRFDFSVNKYKIGA